MTLLPLLGFTLEYRFVNFDEKGAWNKRILRLILGLIGAGVLYSLFKVADTLLFKDVDGISVLAMAFRFIRYFVIGLWISYGAPHIFIKLKLSKVK